MSKFADQINDLLSGGDKIVTQHMHDWDGVMSTEALARVYAQEAFDNTQQGIAGKADGKGRIRPSNLSEKCARLHVLSWMGAPKDISDDTLMKDGQQRHYWWQKAGLSAGFLRDIEVKVQIPYLEIAGSMDGDMVDDSVFEFKTTGPTLYDKYVKERRPAFEHLLQVHAYMKARDTKKASIVYEKRSYKVEWHEFRVDFDPNIFNQLVGRIAPALDAMAHGVLPPMLEECLGLTGPTFMGCKYHSVCPSAEFEVK